MPPIFSCGADASVVFGASLLAAAINTVCRRPVAWSLVRHSCLGRTVADALIDLPFALIITGLEQFDDAGATATATAIATAAMASPACRSTTGTSALSCPTATR